MISEQICEEAQRHEVEAVAELDEKVIEIRNILQNKEMTIQELEKISPLGDNDGGVIKYRDVIKLLNEFTNK